MKVRFENIKSGWVNFTIIENESEIIKDSISYTPYDSFNSLIEAIDSFRKEYKTTKNCTVILNSEPYEYELTFSGTNENVQLLIVGFPDWKRGLKKGSEIYKCKGSFTNVCLPFWRAMRALQGLYSPDELNGLWHREFPSMALNILSEKIKHEKKIN